MRILAVDDDKNYLYILEKWLSGTHLTTVDNAFDAIRELQKNRYDLVIADIYMPEMSGIKLVEYIKKKFYVKILILTNDHTYNINRLENIKHKYQKPNSKSELLEIIEKIIKDNDK